MINAPAIQAEKGNVDGGKDLILLIEVEYADGQFVRYARYDQPVTFEGYTWEPFPILSCSNEESTSGELPTFDIVLTGVGRELASVFESFELENRKGRTLRVHPDHLDDPQSKIEEWFRVKRARASKRMATITVRPTLFDPWGVKVPRDRVTAAKFPGILSARSRF